MGSTVENDGILTQSTAEQRKESGQTVTAEYCQKLLRLGRTTEGEEPVFDRIAHRGWSALTTDCGTVVHKHQEEGGKAYNFRSHSCRRKRKEEETNDLKSMYHSPHIHHHHYHPQQ